MHDSAEYRFWHTILFLGNVWTSCMFGWWQNHLGAGLFMLGLLSVVWIAALCLCAAIKESTQL
jgi:hypothetical protein